MSEPDAAIRIRSLTKRYGDVEAIRGIDLDVWVSEIFGIIGPDGAGKTSTFQILGGVMEATSGAAELLGQPARQARAYVGYLTQAFSLYQDLSVAENLRYVGELRGVPVREIEQRGQHYLTMFGMERFTDRLAGRLSGGMKQKLALACALVAEPRILLLDEPTTGVDPVSRREFWDALAQLSSQGMTILLATPYLDEAERCHRVALMHDGRLHRTGTPAELRQSLGLQRLEVRARDLRGAETALAQRDGIVDVQRFGDRLDVLVHEVQAGEHARGITDAREHLRRDPARPRGRQARGAVPGPPRRRAGRRSDRHRRARPAQDVRRVRRGPGHRPRGALRRGLRPARRQRGGEDHDHQDALRPGGAERGRGAARGRGRSAPLGGRAAAGRLHVAEVLALRRPHHQREPRLLRRRLRRVAGWAGGPQALGARVRGPRGPGRSADGQPAGRVEAARGVWRGDHARDR